MFTIELSSRARRFLNKAAPTLATRVRDKLAQLATAPFPPEVRRVVNRSEKLFRVRVGDYRICYVVCCAQRVIIVTAIAARPRAYA